MRLLLGMSLILASVAVFVYSALVSTPAYAYARRTENSTSRLDDWSLLQTDLEKIPDADKGLGYVDEVGASTYTVRFEKKPRESITVRHAKQFWDFGAQKVKNGYPNPVVAVTGNKARIQLSDVDSVTLELPLEAKLTAGGGLDFYGVCHGVEDGHFVGVSDSDTLRDLVARRFDSAVRWVSPSPHAKGGRISVACKAGAPYELHF